MGFIVKERENDEKREKKVLAIVDVSEGIRDSRVQE